MTDKKSKGLRKAFIFSAKEIQLKSVLINKKDAAGTWFVIFAHLYVVFYNFHILLP